MAPIDAQEITAQVRVGSGGSDAGDAGEAGTAAATQAVAALDGEPPDLVIVYASVRYDLPALLAAIRAVTGSAPLVGETSTGHFRDGELTQPGTGVAVLALTRGGYRFGVASVTRLSDGAEEAGAQLARRSRAAVGAADGGHGTLMIFADGLAPEAQALVNGLHRVTGSTVPVVGGAAGDDRRLSRTYVFHDDRALHDSAVAVWIRSDHPLPVAVGHGWQAVGMPLLVTRTEGAIVYEIGGRPAREVFEEHIRVGDTEQLDRVRPGGYYSTYAFGLIEPDDTHLVRGVFVAADGMIHTFEPLPQYSAIQIVTGDEDQLLAVSEDVVRQALDGREQPSVLLVFSCIARLDLLQERGGEEAERLQAAAGEMPTFGVYTYGEFARTTSVAGYHNSTVTAIAL